MAATSSAVVADDFSLVEAGTSPTGDNQRRRTADEHLTVGQQVQNNVRSENTIDTTSNNEIVPGDSEASSSRGGKGEKCPREPDLLLMLQLCLVTVIEGADGVLLPCAFYALRRDLGLTLGDLATLGVVQAMASVLAAPVWAALADRGVLTRRAIISFGCVAQGVLTILLAMVTWWMPMIFLRALNGVMLASLRPIASGILADATSESCRGKVFGRINFTLQAGMLVGTMTATPMSDARILGLQGWRVAFALIGGLAVLIGALVGLWMKEPGREAVLEAPTSKACPLIQEATRVASFFKVATFNVLILQGVFGMVGMNAGGFATMYFQMVGVSSFQAGLITSFGQIACAIGILMGGYVGDWFARRCRHHGRVLVAEVSLAIGVPLKFLTFWGFPGIEGSIFWYILLTSVHGLIATWVVAGSKLPLLSEIVPPDSRSAVMAWDGTLEGAWGTLLGGPMVAVLARSLFGFSDADDARAQGGENAAALGHATAVMICGPATISLMCWALMHWSFPRDLRRLRAKRAAAAPAASEVRLQG